MQKKIIACTFFGHRNYRGQENEFLKQVVIEQNYEQVLKKTNLWYII